MSRGKTSVSMAASPSLFLAIFPVGQAPTLKLVSQFPAFVSEVAHCLIELIQGVFFANYLENNITYSACCFDGVAQPFEIYHPSADWIMTPCFQTCVRNMHECNIFLMREQTRYGILLYVSSIGDVVHDLKHIIVDRTDDTRQVPDGRSEAIGSIFQKESCASLFGQWNQIAQTLVHPSIHFFEWRRNHRASCAGRYHDFGDLPSDRQVDHRLDVFNTFATHICARARQIDVISTSIERSDPRTVLTEPCFY